MNTYLTVCACFLVSLTGCSHDHPVADPNTMRDTHYDLYTLGNAYAFASSASIRRSPISSSSIRQYEIPPMRPFGYLTKQR